MLFSLVIDLYDIGTSIDQAFQIHFVSVGDVNSICNVDGTNWSGSGWSTDDAIADCSNGLKGSFLGRYRAW
jgi:hypothetical protein